MPGPGKTGGGSSSWKQAESSFIELSTGEALVWGGKEKLYTLLSTRRLDARSYTAEGKEGGGDEVGPPLRAYNTFYPILRLLECPSVTTFSGFYHRVTWSDLGAWVFKDLPSITLKNCFQL